MAKVTTTSLLPSRPQVCTIIACVNMQREEFLWRRCNQIAFIALSMSSALARLLGQDAGRKAVETAAGSLRDLRVAEVTKMDMRVDNGKVTVFRTRVALLFKYEVE